MSDVFGSRCRRTKGKKPESDERVGHIFVLGVGTRLKDQGRRSQPEGKRGRKKGMGHAERQHCCMRSRMTEEKTTATVGSACLSKISGGLRRRIMIVASLAGTSQSNCETNGLLGYKA